MKIITQHFCPYCERVELALKIRKIPSESLHNQVIENGVFPAEFCSINPNKTFPTMVLTSHSGFGESMVIIEYLDSLDATGPKLLGNSAETIARIKSQLENVQNIILNPLKNMIFTYGSKVEERKCSLKMAQVFENFMKLLSDENKRFFGGDDLNIIDVAIAPFVMRYLATHIQNDQIPMPECGSRADKYFHDISHHSLIRKCLPNKEDLAKYLLKFSKTKGINVDKIKSSSRDLVTNLSDEFSKLNIFSLPITWKMNQSAKGNSLFTSIEFKNSDYALAAINLLNEIQEASDHHAVSKLTNLQTLEIDLCTHQPKYGITSMDFAFAEYFSDRIKSLVFK